MYTQTQTQIHLRSYIDVDTSNFAKKCNLASLKSDFDKLGIDNLKTTSIGLSKLSDVVKNEVVKKTLYDKLVQKGNAIQTNVKKT